MSMFRKKKTETGERVYIENVEATATKAMISENGDPDLDLPWIQIKFTRGRWGKSDYEELEVMLPLKKASKLGQQLLNALSAATPRVPTPAKSIPWGE